MSFENKTNHWDSGSEEKVTPIIWRRSVGELVCWRGRKSRVTMLTLMGQRVKNARGETSEVPPTVRICCLEKSEPREGDSVSDRFKRLFEEPFQVEDVPETELTSF